MKKLILATALATVGFGAFAQTSDVAVVVSVQPRMVTVTQRQCGMQEVVRDNSRGDTTIGALAGGAIGSTIGGNSRDRLVGGVAGALIGGAIGNDIGKDSARAEMREVCRYVPVTMQQGSIVTFNYHGQMFTQQFAQ
jgi:uncharacterized protein YcfJ